MSAEISERSVGGLRWLWVRGPRAEVFRALGGVAAAEIHAVLGGLPEAGALKAFAETTAGRRLVGEVLAATERTHSRELTELHDLAAGAGFDVDAMVLANLRGDLGGDDGVGCSDLGWRAEPPAARLRQGHLAEHSYIAHNEDGAPALSGRFMLLTLQLDGEQPVTAQWYPGFLPSNAFAATAAGVAWGINHVQVARPAVAPGRHFVARALQHESSFEATIDYLRGIPTAGGFTYTIGDVHSGRVATVEVAAGQSAVVEAAPYIWHTNHLRYLEAPGGAGRFGWRTEPWAT